MPCLRDIFLGNIPKSVRLDTNMSNEKNSPDDVDIEIYSLHYFIELCLKGETVALDMLHTTNDNIEYANTVWMEIVGRRHEFYTKNLKSFVGYARKQAAKYGVKGSRLDAAKEFIDLCAANSNSADAAGFDVYDKMKDIWDKLPVNDHCKFLDDHNVNIKQYQICGKTIQSTMSILYAKGIIQKFYDNYGARAKLASQNDGVDWKAMSHAIRAAVQVKELLMFNTITFPLDSARFLTEVKQGKHEFKSVIHILESLMGEVEQLTEESMLPEKVDRIPWDDFICKKVYNFIEEVDFYLTNEDE
jgi:hypothetical protein